MNATTVAEYIWLDANKKFRSKVRTILHENFRTPEFPDWDYDGSSTGQADGNSSEITIHPVFTCDNPLSNTRDNHIMYSKLVLCETLNVDGTPTVSNTRAQAHEIFSLPICENLKPWFGLEQEYFIMSDTVEREANSLFGETKDHYCGIGREIVYRNIAEEHMMACIKARLNISGMNAEVSKNQWEFQIGPSVGIKASDELLMARFILERIAEKHGKIICYEPKPFANINGSGCHTNFSTTIMRSLGGIKEIHRVIQNMENNHSDNIKLYGANNESRLSGKYETSDYKTFTWGVGHRGVSARINNRTNRDGFGYLEDRRPAANMDPYLVTAAIMANVI
jgi:glutamine synthetase